MHPFSHRIVKFVTFPQIQSIYYSRLIKSSFFPSASFLYKTSHLFSAFSDQIRNPMKIGYVIKIQHTHSAFHVLTHPKKQPRVGICLLYPLYIFSDFSSTQAETIGSARAQAEREMYRGYRRHMPTRGVTPDSILSFLL